MKNLLARERDRRDGQLWCPLLVATTCRRESCAHYNPGTNECVHVEAARAQVRAADMLERAARAIEYLAECTTDPCIQPRRVLGITRE
jgi:hypothetical protein